MRRCLQTASSRARILCIFSAQFLRGFVVSANLRNTLLSFYRGSCQIPKPWAILHKTFTKNAQTNIKILALEIPYPQMPANARRCLQMPAVARRRADARRLVQTRGFMGWGAGRWAGGRVAGWVGGCEQWETASRRARPVDQDNRDVQSATPDFVIVAP